MRSECNFKSEKTLALKWILLQFKVDLKNVNNYRRGNDCQYKGPCNSVISG